MTKADNIFRSCFAGPIRVKLFVDMALKCNKSNQFRPRWDAAFSTASKDHKSRKVLTFWPINPYNQQWQSAFKAQWVVCFCHLLKYFRSLFDKQCRPRSDWSCLIRVHNVCPYTYICQIMIWKIHSRQLKQMAFSDDFLQVLKGLNLLAFQ